jgi:plasmid stabilization system protein ParE
MKKYRIKIASDALSDIREIKYWYDSQKISLGNTFKDTVIKQINGLTENPQIFAIRYEEIRCMLVRKFPYMVHFYINQKISIVEVLAVISTDRNPKIWEEKTNRF